jgi:predicted helicase
VEIYQLQHIDYPALVVPGLGNRKAFGVISIIGIPSLDLAFEKCQVFSLSHLSDTALAAFQSHYANPTLTKLEVFHYLYALLHHPAYRARYAEALKKELPRIPFAPDFAAFEEIGAALMRLHLHYEQLEPYPLTHTDNPAAPYSPRVEGKMKLAKDRRSLQYNSSLTLSGIPEDAFDYRLGHRSALEWVIDQYQLKKDDAGHITSDPNRPNDPEYILRLLGQVIALSLETNRLTAALSSLLFTPRI